MHTIFEITGSGAKGVPASMSPALKPISILLVDDHPLVRAGIRTLLEKLPESSSQARLRMAARLCI